jgi:hypothetical protein
MKRSLLEKIKKREIVHENRSVTGNLLGRYLMGYEWRFASRLFFLHPLLTAFLFFAILLAIVSLFANWSQAFARSGALISCAAILLQFAASRRYKSEIMKQSHELLIEEIDSRSETRIEKALIGWQRDKDPRVSMPNPKSPEEIVNLLDKKEKPFVRMETSLLLLGTLVWAFGDWFSCSVHSWSLSTCSP